MSTPKLPGRSGSVLSLIPPSLIPQFSPLLQPLQHFFGSYLGIDLTTFVTLFLAWGYLSGAARRTWDSLYNLLIKWFISTITIPAHDRLNKEVLQWLSAKVVTQQGTRFLTAMSTKGASDIEHYVPLDLRRRLYKEEIDDTTPPIRYLPAFGNTWFFFEKKLFLLHRSNNTQFRFEVINTSEPLVLMCLGRSPQPIKRFLQACKDFTASEKKGLTSIHNASPTHRHSSPGWSQTMLKPSRPLDTVELPAQVKQALLKDITEFLAPSARRYYATRGIPYRRGYLFHGPPGTGKTSLSLALAGHLNLELYILSLAGGRISEWELLRLFADLPPKCLVLLEDIDSAGLTREAADDHHGNGEAASSSAPSSTSRAHSGRSTATHHQNHHSSSRSASGTPDRPPKISLSGLLNAVDGVAAQEGRVLIMTSNVPAALDSALVRPGRVDMQVAFGNVGRSTAESIFERMYTKEDEDDDLEGGGAVGAATATKHEEGQEEEETESERIQRLAELFASRIPEDRLTPAEVQGFLLMHREEPGKAVEGVEDWVRRTLAAKEETGSADGLS